MLKLKFQCFGHLMLTNWLTGKDPDAGKDWRQVEKGTTEDKMVGWHHRPDGHEFEQTPGIGDGQGGLACCSPWGHKESDMTEWLDWTELPRRQAGCAPRFRKPRKTAEKANSETGWPSSPHLPSRGPPRPVPATTGVWLPSNSTGMTPAKSPSFPSCHILSKTQSTARANRWATVLSCVTQFKVYPWTPEEDRQAGLARNRPTTWKSFISCIFCSLLLNML